MEILRQFLSVVFVLAMLAGVLWWLRRKSPVRPGWRFRLRRDRGGARLEVVERLPLTAQHTLHLVRVADRALLVAVHTSGCSLIDSRPWREVEDNLPASAGAAAMSGAER